MIIRSGALEVEIGSSQVCATLQTRINYFSKATCEHSSQNGNCLYSYQILKSIRSKNPPSKEGLSKKMEALSPENKASLLREAVHCMRDIIVCFVQFQY